VPSDKLEGNRDVLMNDAVLSDNGLETNIDVIMMDLEERDQIVEVKVTVRDASEYENGTIKITYATAESAKLASSAVKRIIGGRLFDVRRATLRTQEGCSAILAKTCSQMEGPYVKYVKAQFNKPVFLVGPVVPDPPSGKLEERWSSWLNKFEAGIVIYCSFGSETFLKDEQIKELALGLEQTGLSFFLVLNFPANDDLSVELNRALPEGFLERLVISSY
uniref:Anthocyanidin 3-O-glucosyltransferase-like n=1 Tax=Nicotiana tabacum TaxID=4097 RepID=A0A1S4CHZ7_TOBAC